MNTTNILGLFALTFFVVSLILVAAYKNWQAKRRLTVFRYTYQSYPWDKWSFFTVEANNQDEADSKADNKFRELFEQGNTILTAYYRADGGELPLRKHAGLRQIREG